MKAWDVSQIFILDSLEEFKKSVKFKQMLEDKGYKVQTKLRGSNELVIRGIMPKKIICPICGMVLNKEISFHSHKDAFGEWSFTRRKKE